MTAFVKVLGEMANRRLEVLTVYKQILRVGQKWVAKSQLPDDTKAEKDYIFNEARTLFRENKALTDADAIAKCIAEAKTRLSIAIHYKIPYPRPVNVKPLTFSRIKIPSKLREEKK